jgi:hypothetical protein
MPGNKADADGKDFLQCCYRSMRMVVWPHGIKRSNGNTTPRSGLIGEIKKLAAQQEWMVNDPI